MKIAGAWFSDPAPKAAMVALKAGGHCAYYVGGAVRDAILGLPHGDIDIATDARPEEVMALAEAAGLKAVPTGIEHGTVTLVSGGIGIEVTTFRRDVETDGRRALVAFSDDLADDARRRDFTMNALYADEEGEIADPLGGLPDLLARRIRFVGAPEDRIREDYLRILRFFRFHAWFGDPAQAPDAEGLAACAALARGIARLSKERVGAEMKKLLAAPDPAPALAAMAAAGVLAQALPGADTKALAPLVHLEAEAGAAPDPIRRLAAVGGEAAPERLKLSRAEAKALAAIAAAAREGTAPGELGYRLGKKAGLSAILVRAALVGAPLPAQAAPEIERGAAARFPVRAADLMPVLSGPALGRRLDELEARWIASGFRLSKSELLALP